MNGFKCGMLFRAFEGQLMLSIHAPSKLTEERAVFLPMIEKDGRHSGSKQPR
ncbi:hypothetical protein [Paenibacillus harenae]|uniref:Uncharacterized protein n=1 Tax=Paenibacillus harenae TaxID=306543 RepID=A0ABT9U616_PAEHA|nr:hypothetical protein [Paenibacillus harenae]MDQ0115085.1 hypothetical protein [Paenibacillus harenae]